MQITTKTRIFCILLAVVFLLRTFNSNWIGTRFSSFLYTNSLICLSCNFLSPIIMLKQIVPIEFTLSSFVMHIGNENDRTLISYWNAIFVNKTREVAVHKTAPKFIPVSWNQTDILIPVLQTKDDEGSSRLPDQFCTVYQVHL